MINLVLVYTLLCLITVTQRGYSYPSLLLMHDCIQGGLPGSDTISVGGLDSLLQKKAKVKVIDVRLPKDFQADPGLIPSATWQDPNQVESWAKTLSKDTPIVVYCVHGHHISQQVAERLLSLGYPARKLAGGIHAWKEAKGKTNPTRR